MRTRRGSWRFGGLLAVVIGLGAAVGSAAPATAQASGPVLIDEDFQGASVAAEFQGYGSACLTGAAPVVAAAPGEHPLTGCSAVGVGPVPPAGGAPDGYLQLTGAANDQAGAMLSEKPIPSTTGVEISFEQWQYGGTQTPAPADGISFFLVDGAVALDAPGAFGGSLGYAQKLPDDDPAGTVIPGVNGGYLGIGLDVLGNYFGDWEHRGDGCAQRSPSGTAFYVPAPGANMVTVRGPGDGTTGYCFLTATTPNLTTTGPWPSSLPGQLQGPLTGLPPGTDAATAAALLEPSKRTVTIDVTPAPDPTVTVSIDFNDGAGTQQVLSFPAPQPVPTTYKLGFAASTGLFTDVHLIRTLRVQALAPLPALSLTKAVETPGPIPAVAGTIVRYLFTVTNTGGTAVDSIAIQDPRIGEVSCAQTSLAPGASTTCTGSYAVTAADAAAGTVVNTATATGAAPDGSGVTSDPASATVTLVAPAPPSGTATLADSGSSSRGGVLGAGIAIALLGALLVAAGPRRERTTRSPNC